MSTLIDFTPLVQPIAECFDLVIGAALTFLAHKAIAAFQRRTGIILTAQQVTTVQDFVKTSAGVIESKLDQGALQIEHVNISNPTIRAEAQSILIAAPIASAALGMTPDRVAKMIVGAVDTGSHGLATSATTGTSAPAIVLVPKGDLT